MVGDVTTISLGPVFHGVGSLFTGSGSGCGGGIDAVGGNFVKSSSVGDP